MKNIILDTDIYNEVDDQFALAYILKSKDIFNLKAVTIAPFTKGDYTPRTSIDKSYDTAINIFKLCGEKDFSKIYKGSKTYFDDFDNCSIEAVEKIIDIAMNNEDTYIICIGCLTNLALAIKKCKKIIKRIKVIWLGTNFLFMENNDFNFRQDVSAVKYIFKNKIDLVIIPTYPVSYGLIISKYELENRLKNRNDICNYFCNIFTKDYGNIVIRRPLWDISAVAYLINENWFETFQISTPIIREDKSFKLTKYKNKIKFVQKIDSNKIYDDMFERINR